MVTVVEGVTDDGKVRDSDFGGIHSILIQINRISGALVKDQIFKPSHVQHWGFTSVQFGSLLGDWYKVIHLFKNYLNIKSKNTYTPDV